MKNKRFQIICWCLALVPLVLTAIAMPTLPDAVPMHWNAAGEIDRWGSRSSAWMMPLMCIGVNLLFVVLPKIDPKRDNYTSFRKSYDIFRMVFNLFLIVMTGITITSAFSPETVRTRYWFRRLWVYCSACWAITCLNLSTTILSASKRRGPSHPRKSGAKLTGWAVPFGFGAAWF